MSGWVFVYVLPALKVAAVVHAIRAGVAPYWFCVIVLVPFGELIYAASVLMPGGSVARRVVAKRDRRGLRELRYAYEQNPSLQHEVELADRLAAEGETAEATSLYQRALARDASYLRALYGLGVCQLGAGLHEAAALNLRRVVEASRTYDEYRAWLALAQALRAQGRTDEAVAELEKLFAASPRLAHAVELGGALGAAGRTDEARRLVERAIEDHRHAPRHVRRDSRAAFRRARELATAL
jgi:hypothetical protein